MASQQLKQARKLFEEQFFTAGSRYTIHATYLSRSDKVLLDENVRADRERLESKVQDVIVAHVTRLPGPHSSLPYLVNDVPVVYVKATRCQPE